MNSIVTGEIGLEEGRTKYIGFYQETADFFNELLTEGGSVAQRLEDAAIAGGLAVESTRQRTATARNDEGARVTEMSDLYITLPDSGEFNRRYLTSPHLIVTEHRENSVTTLLQANVEGQGGTEIGSADGEGPTTIGWIEDVYTDDGVIMEPDLDDARWTAEGLITSEGGIEFYFRPAEALVNALRGIAGEFVER